MEIEWKILADTGFMPTVAEQPYKLKPAIPHLLAQLQKRYGGTLPASLSITLVHGPVEIGVYVKDGELHRTEATGKCIRQGDRAWVLLTLDRELGRNAIHEFLHMLGLTDEQFVRRAVKDFIHLEKWALASRIDEARREQ